MPSYRRHRVFAANLAAFGILVASCSSGKESPPATLHAISGTVSGAVRSGVTVRLTGAATSSATTDASGNYSFPNLADGSYTIAPSLAGYAFSPASLSVTLAGADVTGRNFTAVAVGPTHAISGTVSGAVRSGVTVSLTGAATSSATTDASGNYGFPGLADGSYTVRPVLAGYAFTPSGREVTLTGADVGGQDFLSGAAACPSTTSDTTGLALYDTLCGPVLDGSLWQIPGAASRAVANGEASMRLAVANEEPRALRNSSYNSYAAVLASQRVTTLRAGVAVPAAGASRSGGADVRAVLRLVYQPPARRLAFPGGYQDVLALEVGLLDAGEGLYAFRQVVHCDDASCSSVSATGVDFTDPAGLVPLELGLQAGTPAAYDTSYTLQVTLDEAAGTFGWTISGGGFGASGISGTADPSAYLAATPGWSGVPLAGTGFSTAQLGVSSRDSSVSGGGRADVTGRFSNVWVGLAGAAPSLWDDFSDTGNNSGPSGFSALKWSPAGNTSSLPSGGSLVQHADLAMPPGGSAGYSAAVANNVAFPAGIDTLQGDVVVPSPISGSATTVYLQGRFFNDGTAGGQPSSALGDIQATVYLSPSSSTAGWSIQKCTSATCGTATTVGGGTLTAAAPFLDSVHTLRLGFDPATHLFTLRVDGSGATPDPTTVGNGITAPVVYQAAANAPFRALGSIARVSTTATTGSLSARFNNVYVSAGAVAACNALANAGPTVQPENVAQAAPTPAGGTFSDGTYYLTAESYYTGPGGASGPAGATLKQVLVVGGNTVQFVGRVGGSSDERGTFSVSTSGTEATVVGICGNVGGGTNGYTAGPTEFRIYTEEPGGTREDVYTRQ